MIRRNRSTRSRHLLRGLAARASLTALVSVVMAGFGTAGMAASAAPHDVTTLPDPLRKYVPGSSTWASSPWMTSESCKDKGGDFSLWVASVIGDIPELLRIFYTELYAGGRSERDAARNVAVVAGYRQLSTEFRDKVPAGYCVDDLRRWAGANPQYQPFGFVWGLHHQTFYGCTDGRAQERGVDADNRWVGAERVACAGFFIACDGAASAEQARCDAWNQLSMRFVARSEALRGEAINRYPATASGTVVSKPNVFAIWVVAAAAAVAVIPAVWFALRHSRRSSRGRSAGGSADVDV